MCLAVWREHWRDEYRFHHKACVLGIMIGYIRNCILYERDLCSIFLELISDWLESDCFCDEMREQRNFPLDPPTVMNLCLSLSLSPARSHLTSEAGLQNSLETHQHSNRGTFAGVDFLSNVCFTLCFIAAPLWLLNQKFIFTWSWAKRKNDPYPSRSLYPEKNQEFSHVSAD